MIRISVISPKTPMIKDNKTQYGELSVFKGGEVNVKLNEGFIEDIKSEESIIRLSVHFTCSNDFFALALLVDAIRRVVPGKPIYVDIPYFPYARQDRVCNKGEALSVAVMAKLINSLDLTQVVITDPHSDVVAPLINNVVIVSQLDVVRKHLLSHFDQSKYTLVAPDQGAYKKSLEIAKTLGFGGFAHASKTRDPKTMEITGLELYGNVKNKNVMVIDDIIDGGRTFIELGKKLKEAGAHQMILFATHGIFSYGVDKLVEVYQEVHTTNSFHMEPRRVEHLNHARVVFHEL